MWIVQIIESERGWGQKVEDEVSFTTEAGAKLFQKHYNGKHNNEKVVPDWYMCAADPFERIEKHP